MAFRLQLPDFHYDRESQKHNSYLNWYYEVTYFKKNLQFQLTNRKFWSYHDIFKTQPRRK